MVTVKLDQSVQLQPAEDDSWPPRAEHDVMWGIRRNPHKWRPATDVFETGETYRVVVEIAGMRGADISVTFEQGTLAIRGERHETDAQRAYHQMEIPFGEFESVVELPEPIAAGNIEAAYVDGFLRVTLPKLKPTKVEID